MLIAKMSYLRTFCQPTPLGQSTTTHASVKNPTPATMATLTWNHLRAATESAKNAFETSQETHENLALSTSAKAARRRSSSTYVASSPFWASDECESLSEAISIDDLRKVGRGGRRALASPPSWRVPFKYPPSLPCAFPHTLSTRHWRGLRDAGQCRPSHVRPGGPIRCDHCSTC